MELTDAGERPFYNHPHRHSFHFPKAFWNDPCVRGEDMEPTAEVFTQAQEARIVVEEMWLMSLLRRIAAATIILAALTGLAAIAFA